MRRFTSCLLIVFVLFTHSSMAVDVHFPEFFAKQDTPETYAAGVVHGAGFNSEAGNDGLTASFTENSLCQDAGGHCSHHQAHTAGLFAVNSLPVITGLLPGFAQFETRLFFHIVLPPRKPPKA